MILVTGGTGLVGSHLLYNLVKAGHNVRALKRSTSNLNNVRTTFAYYSDNIESLFNQIHWIDGDMLDPDTLEEAMDGVTHLYHTAALVSFNGKDHEMMRRINLVGTRHLVNLCIQKKIEKLCFVSSVAALGNPEEGDNTVTESTPWSPEDNRSGYSLSKFESELEVWRGINEGLNAVIVNPSIILGPGQWDKGSSQLFTTVAKGLKFFTRGITGYVDVRDVSNAMIQLMESDIHAQRFILNGENRSYEYIFKTIAHAINIPEPTTYAAPWMTEIGWRLASLKKILFLGTPSFTRETARTAHSKKYFSNDKICKALDFKFTPIQQTINNIAKHYPL